MEDDFRGRLTSDEMLMVSERGPLQSSGDWSVHFRTGVMYSENGDLYDAVESWIEAFELMPSDRFDESFPMMVDMLEKNIIETLWRSIDELHIENLGDLAYTIFINYPEKRSEDTDLLIVLIKRLNKHIDDINHVRYIVDLLDLAEMLSRTYFAMNVEIRTYMYVADLVLGLGSQIILKSIKMLETYNDRDESLRTMHIVGEIVNMFTKLRDTIFIETEIRTKEEMDSLVMSWSTRNAEEYLIHLDRAFEMSMEAYVSDRYSPEYLQGERDREIERFVEIYFSS